MNQLINSRSPYLRQHAHNPVHWQEWNEAALAYARQADKPIIVSIGYSACHWCHVMERESFEDEQIAALMNEHFVCIKVDREERPDVDAIYMDAVQAMGVQGGWPLNAFLTPDAKPFYAGTYFPPRNWKNLLLKVAEIFRDNRAEVEQTAAQLHQNIAVSELRKYGIAPNPHLDWTNEQLAAAFQRLVPSFDPTYGGIQKAPKFPMPCLWEWVLQLAYSPNEHPTYATARTHLHTTLRQIIRGGIYDQIGGGWARYSVDSQWFAPHFEKMLYDNAQLIKLYSLAYSASGDEEYKQAVYQSVEFLERELMSDEGGLYAALDADSEGVEGKYYTWTLDEVKAIFADAPSTFALLCQYYHLEPEGNWEHGVNILYRRESITEFALKKNISESEWQHILHTAQQSLLAQRAQRIRPGIDDKILTAWNGLAITGLIAAYNAFGEAKFIDLARKIAVFIDTKLKSGSRLYRNYQGGTATLYAYLEDYAAVIEAYTALYEATLEEEWLRAAEGLMQYVFAHFFDAEEGLFYYTDVEGESLIARKKELFDNVMPASNSMMAHNLYRLGLLLTRQAWASADGQAWVQQAREMTAKMRRLIDTSPEYLANWARLAHSLSIPTAEIVITGIQAPDFRADIARRYYPHKVMLGASAILPDNAAASAPSSKIYVCYAQTCRLPADTPAAAWQQIVGEG